jgi:hypothetical protein
MEQKNEQKDEWSCNHATKECVVYSIQVATAISVIIVSIINLSFESDTSKRQVWLVLLSSCLGYVLPSPTINKK